MDAKMYIVWRGASGVWVVLFHGNILHESDTQEKARDWLLRTHPGQGYEIERVQVRENSPPNARIGEWR